MSDMQERLDDYYARQVDRVALRYRDLAYKIEQVGKNVRPRMAGKFDDHLAYSDAGARVVQEIMSTSMNSGIEILLNAAADADYSLRAEAAKSGRSDDV